MRALTRGRLSWEVGGNFSANEKEVVGFGDHNLEFVELQGFTQAPAFAVRGASIGVFRGLDFMRRGRDLTHLSVAIQ